MKKQSNERQERGRQGEAMALQFLQSRGYTICDRNFRFGRLGELDIIAEDGEFLVFVEVKLRRSASYGPPELAITPAKKHKLRQLGKAYLYLKGIRERDCRFDIIAIDYIADDWKIRHIRNAL